VKLQADAPMKFPSTAPRVHTSGGYHREEVALANRNHGHLLEMLRYDVTPAGLHYLLIHFDVPYVADANTWSFAIDGRVARPQSISVAAVKALPQTTLRVTLECAGNGRAKLEPRWTSMPWHDTAVGTAEWTGTPLRHVLDAAGVLPNAHHIVCYGADRGFDHVEHDYGRALTPEMAMRNDVLLVTAMNGQPLLPQHGFPLRLIVPGWYGMASVKWLNRISVWDRPFDGPQQVATYVYRNAPGDVGTPVTSMRVKSLMVPPGIPDWYTRNRVVDAGQTTVHGRAWSGNGVPIEKVEFAVNGVWHAAELLAQPASKYAWREWTATWSAEVGSHELACRATDATGETQPLAPRHDNAGFGNNTVQRVPVIVRGER
jgi:DMSO/TMAO reductase YedYZ molybdopterin-dependent catalytic subunit